MTDLSTLFQCITWIICVLSLIGAFKWFIKSNCLEYLDEYKHLTAEIEQLKYENESLKSKLDGNKFLSDINEG